MDQLQADLLAKVNKTPRKFRELLGHDPTPDERVALNALLESGHIKRIGQKRGSRYCLPNSPALEGADVAEITPSAPTEPTQEMLDLVLSGVSDKPSSFKEILGGNPTNEHRLAMRALIAQGKVRQEGEKRMARYMLGDGTIPPPRPPQAAVVVEEEDEENEEIEEEDSISDNEQYDDLPVRQRVRLKQMPTSYRKTYLKAVTGSGRANAVKAMCAECTGYDRKAVGECSDNGCPLWAFRPYRKKN